MILDDYFIKRPWDTAFFKDTDPFSEIYNGGIDVEHIITIMLKTLFEINNIDINISFKEFYNKNDMYKFTLSQIKNYEMMAVNKKIDWAK